MSFSIYYIQLLLILYYNKNEIINLLNSSAAGFEPTRAMPTRFQVWRLNHSAILTFYNIY